MQLHADMHLNEPGGTPPRSAPVLAPERGGTQRKGWVRRVRWVRAGCAWLAERVARPWDLGAGRVALRAGAGTWDAEKRVGAPGALGARGVLRRRRGPRAAWEVWERGGGGDAGTCGR